MELDPSAVQLLSEDGTFTEHPDYPLGLSDADIIGLYRRLILVRRADVEAINLQRQGYLKLWGPVFGQEAAQVGSAAALQPGDRAFPQGRQFGVGLTVGIDPAEMLSVWRGEIQGGGWSVEASGIALYTFPIGSQAPHAVGYGMALQRDQKNAAVIAYLGDGAFGTGDVHESLLWSALYKSPVVFFCENNQYALSNPVERSAPLPLFRRSEGFGLPGVQVDGNDVLGCYAVTARAARRARAGEGPTLVEALTYRIGPHTTSDDPDRYRKADEVATWRMRDPIIRMRDFVLGAGLVTRADLDAIDQEAEVCATAVRAACVADPAPVQPVQMFDHVYGTRPQHLEAERRAWLAFNEETQATS
jgi:2-oxoisovalerate dehydrogenase E1 component alpha subunit